MSVFPQDMFSPFQDLKHPEKLYKLGQAVGANVVQVSLKPLRLSLSLTGERPHTHTHTRLCCVIITAWIILRFYPSVPGSTCSSRL